MGLNKTKFAVLTEDVIEEYTILTYLTKSEILHIFKIFSQIEHDEILKDLNSRFSCYAIENIFTQLKHNPFKDRIFSIFSSLKDGRMSFEDILDLCSVMSERCPDNVKAAWAFHIFDFDGDGFIGEQDLISIIERLTQSAGFITELEENHIIKILIKEINLESNGKITVQEFIHALGKIPDFPHSFSFRF